MLQMAWPIMLVVCSNIFYQISSKSTPTNINPFVSLMVTYCVAAVVSVIVYFVGRPTVPFTTEITGINWASAVLGIAIVGLETGYIFAYRAGWNISVCSLVANISLACCLIIVGVFLYKETLSIKQVCGIIVCIIGLFLVVRG